MVWEWIPSLKHTTIVTKLNRIPSICLWCSDFIGFGSFIEIQSILLELEIVHQDVHQSKKTDNKGSCLIDDDPATGFGESTERVLNTTIATSSRSFNSTRPFKATSCVISNGIIWRKSSSEQKPQWIASVQIEKLWIAGSRMANICRNNEDAEYRGCRNRLFPSVNDIIEIFNVASIWDVISYQR